MWLFSLSLGLVFAWYILWSNLSDVILRPSVLSVLLVINIIKANFYSPVHTQWAPPQHRSMTEHPLPSGSLEPDTQSGLKSVWWMNEWRYSVNYTVQISTKVFSFWQRCSVVTKVIFSQSKLMHEIFCKINTLLLIIPPASKSRNRTSGGTKWQDRFWLS